MHIAYIANIRFPTEKAHGYQIARVASALASRGVSVTLYVPRRRNYLTAQWDTYYGVSKNFEVVKVPCIDLMIGNRAVDKIAFVVQMVTFAFCLLFVRIKKTTAVMTRDKGLAWFFGIRGFTVVYNVHSVKESSFTTRTLSKASGVVCNSQGAQEVIQKLYDVPTVVIPNGSDVNPYVDRDSSSLREELALPQDKTIVLYSGHLYGWKGVDTVVGAAERLVADARFLFVCIGGLAADVSKYQQIIAEKGLSNILFLGHVSKFLVPKYLCAADILLLPNSAESEESRTQTSPLKLFEYLAAKRTIIASNLPSIASVVTENEVLFVQPDDAVALAFSLQYVLEHREQALARNARAYALSERYTWDTHAASLERFFVQVVTDSKIVV
jgi:glycosyltransferase involved in cell wall biosynthesis